MDAVSMGEIRMIARQLQWSMNENKRSELQQALEFILDQEERKSLPFDAEDLRPSALSIEGKLPLLLEYGKQLRIVLEAKDPFILQGLYINGALFSLCGVNWLGMYIQQGSLLVGAQIYKNPLEARGMLLKPQCRVLFELCHTRAYEDTIPISIQWLGLALHPDTMIP